MTNEDFPLGCPFTQHGTYAIYIQVWKEKVGYLKNIANPPERREPQILKIVS